MMQENNQDGGNLKKARKPFYILLAVLIPLAIFVAVYRQIAEQRTNMEAQETTATQGAHEIAPITDKAVNGIALPATVEERAQENVQQGVPDKDTAITVLMPTGSDPDGPVIEVTMVPLETSHGTTPPPPEPVGDLTDPTQLPGYGE